MKVLFGKIWREKKNSFLPLHFTDFMKNAIIPLIFKKSHFLPMAASFVRTKSPIPYKIRRYGPTLIPYGMNFAVAGTGIFDTGNYQSNLSTQIDQFQSQIDVGVYSNASIRSSAALVVISGNDYAHLAEQDPNFLLVSIKYLKIIVALNLYLLTCLSTIKANRVLVVAIAYSRIHETIVCTIQSRFTSTTRSRSPQGNGYELASNRVHAIVHET